MVYEFSCITTERRPSFSYSQSATSRRATSYTVLLYRLPAVHCLICFDNYNLFPIENVFFFHTKTGPSETKQMPKVPPEDFPTPCKYTTCEVPVQSYCFYCSVQIVEKKSDMCFSLKFS